MSLWLVGHRDIALPIAATTATIPETTLDKRFGSSDDDELMHDAWSVQLGKSRQGKHLVDQKEVVAKRTTALVLDTKPARWQKQLNNPFCYRL